MVTLLIRTLIIYALLIFALRIMGKRQLGELEVSELIITFMLSELATVPISDTEAPLLNAIAPILLLLSLEGMLSFLTMKLPLFKKIIYGKPNILIYEGKINQKELSRERIELSELVCAIRQNGIGSVEDVNHAILEENGKISIFPKADAAPVTPEQLKGNTDDEGISLPIIMDRRVIEENLKLRGWSHSKLDMELSSRRLKVEDVFLFSVDDCQNIYIIKKERKK